MAAKGRIHSWLRTVQTVYVPGHANQFLEGTVAGLMERFSRLGQIVQARPDDRTELLLTTVPFGKPLGWREAAIFTCRRRWNIKHTPTIVTFLWVSPGELGRLLDKFQTALAKEPPDPADFDFPGLNPQAYHTLVEQGRRGGPLLSVMRLLQAQSKCIRLALIVGEDRPLGAFLFDLVGSHPWIDAGDYTNFLDEIALRLITCASTREVTDHEAAGEPIPQAVWRTLSAPPGMYEASRELGKRRFFTEMVRINDLVHTPAMEEVIKSQYSEGCFATWDPDLRALIGTVTGSARPVEKENVSQDDLAVITGVRPDCSGAYIRLVEGKRNDPPSSEAVEMMLMDAHLPAVCLGEEWGRLAGLTVPATRSKLHGHRGIGAYDPRYVEHVFLDPAYYDYPVSCGSEAQARGIEGAFSRSEALRNPGDPRRVVFVILPGHGVMMAEKWTPGKVPFQTIWEYMDAGYLQVVPGVPQGRLSYHPRSDGLLRLRSADPLAEMAASIRRAGLTAQASICS